MKNNKYYWVVLFFTLATLSVFAQEEEIAKAKIEVLLAEKAGITNAERQALKIKVERINVKLEKGDISQDVADEQKSEAAKLHAANIDDRLTIIDKQIALLQRNNNLSNEVLIGSSSRFQWGLGHKNAYDERLFGMRYKRKKPKPFIYDIRTYSDFVISVGNNHLRGKDTYYDIGFPSKEWYYELGWAWRYRINKDNNALRLHYGVSIQHNKFERSELLFEPNFGSYGYVENGVEVIQSTEHVISSTKLTTGSLLFPVHLEMGPSTFRKTESSIRYSIKNKFRLGIGGYFGVNLGLTQLVEGTPVPLTEQFDVLSRAFHSMSGLEKDRLVYGLSAYIGAGSFLFYTKFDLSTLYIHENNKYKIATVGLRIDM